MSKNWVKNVTEKNLYLLMIISVGLLIISNQFIAQKILNKVDAEEYAKFLTSELAIHSQEIELLSFKTVLDSSYYSDLEAAVIEWNFEQKNVRMNDSSLHLSLADTEKVTMFLDRLKVTGDKLNAVFATINGANDLKNQLAKVETLEETYSATTKELYEFLEEISQGELSKLRTVEIIIAIISLILLWLEFQFIIRPFIQELKRRKDKLEKLNKSKDRILATVAHDIRNPISGIEGVLSILSDQIEQLTPEDEELIDLATESCKKSQELIQELLDISLLESEEYHMETEIIHLEQYLKGVLSQFHRQAAEKNIELRVKIDPSHLSAEIDKNRFSRVIENIVSNAIKFTNQGQIDLLSKELEDDILLEIRDTGIGIPDKLKDYIFDKFSRARRLGTKGESTTGLGMSIVKTIVEKHGGKIWLESNEGKGTVFFITLPKISNKEI